MRRLRLPLLILACIGIALAAVTPWIERRLTFFSTRLHEVPREPMPPDTEAIRFATRDGLRLCGLLTRPPGAQGEALYFSGNPGNHKHSLPVAQSLYAEGFRSLIWDYRGFGLSEGDPRDEAAIYLDAEAALSALTERLGTHSTGVILYGYSLGTAPATEMAVRHGCRTLILEPPFASAPIQASVDRPILAALLGPFCTKPLRDGAKDFGRPLPGARDPWRRGSINLGRARQGRVRRSTTAKAADPHSWRSTCIGGADRLASYL